MVGDRLGDLAFLFSPYALPLQSEDHRKVGYLGMSKL